MTTNTHKQYIKTQAQDACHFGEAWVLWQEPCERLKLAPIGEGLTGEFLYTVDTALVREYLTTGWSHLLQRHVTQEQVLCRVLEVYPRGTGLL